MNIKRLVCVFCLVTIGLIACQPQAPASENSNPTPANLLITKSISPTPPPPSVTETILPNIPSATPEWKDRNLIGKIVYVDRTANQIVIMDADGKTSKEISYIPGKTYEPYIGSPIKWSHDGRKLAFGCQKLSDSPDWTFFPIGREEDVRLSLCVLDLIENMQGQNKDILQGLHVIELPEHYMPLSSEGAYSNSRRFASLAWLMKDEEIVLTPFCIVKVEETKTDCTDWGTFDHLTETNKVFLQNAEFIAPSPVDPRKWALTIDNNIIILDLDTGEVKQIDVKYDDLFLYWSPDGNKVIVLSSNAIGLLDIQTYSYERLIWGGEYGMSIEPELITARPGATGSYLLNLYFPRQNIAWSQDSRYFILNVYSVFPFSEAYARIYAALYYFDLERGEIFPARNGSDELGFPTEFQPEWNIDIVKIDEFKLFTSPDWYACDDAENVCELYK